MNDILKVIVSLSLSGSLLILVLLLFKPFLRNRVSRRWQYYIWLVVIARLLLPFSPQESLMGTLFERSAQVKLSAKTAEETGAKDVRAAETGSGKPEAAGTDAADFEAAEIAEMESLGSEASKMEETDSGAWMLRYFRFFWPGVALLLLTWKIAGYYNFVRYIRAGKTEVSDIGRLDLLAEVGEQLGIKRHVELYTNDRTATPLLLGFFRPCIILPDSCLSKKDFRCTVLHELIHYRRRDIVYKWLMQVTVCVHWFNPLVWLMGKEVEAACELSCDEAVLGKLDEEERISYGDTLLHALEDRRGCGNSSAVMTLSAGGKLLKERLQAILDYRGRTKMVRAVSVLLAGALMLGAVLTGAAAPKTGSEKSVGSKPGSSPETVPGDAPGEEMPWETLEVKGTTYYLVFNETQLRAIGEYGPDRDYMQQADIWLSSEEWMPIGTKEHPFTGSFNGNGYEIKGLTMTDSETELTGLFGAARGAHIYNVILRDCDMLYDSGESFDLDEVLGLDLGGTRVYDCIVYSKNKTGNAKDSKEAETYYEAGNLPMFGDTFFLLDEKEQRKWMERLYDEGEIAFFSVSCQQLDKDSPLIGEFAEKAYAEGSVSYFSVLANGYMSEKQLERWLERAVSDKRINFQSVLRGALGRDWEQDALEEELERQRLEEYKKYGLSTEGKRRYYQGQLVNIFLDHAPGSKAYFLDMNPAGTVNVKVLRGTDGAITGMDYMTEEEVDRLFGDMAGGADDR